MHDGLALVLKSIAALLGVLILMAGLVELSVAGATARGVVAVAAGLALAVPPIAFAFRDAARDARAKR